MRRVSLVLVTCVALVVSVAPAVAAPPDNPAGKQRVIVELRPDSASPRGLADQIVGAHGGRFGAVYEHAIKGFAAELPQAAITALSRNPNVVSITPDQIVAIADQDIPTGFDRIEADRAPTAPVSPTNCPAGETCTNVDIAVLDTGSNDHTDLNVVHRVDCSSLFGSCNDNAGYDGHGHGTHVAGIAAAFDNADGVVGVAPGARVWSVKVLGDDGTGFLSSLIAGVDWVAARAGEIDVVNMSLAGAFTNTSFDTAIANSVAAGITFVVAAGNEGVDAVVNSPANHPDVITVSAVADGDAAGGGLGKFLCRQDQTDDTLATFSNYGEVVDIAAPGVCIRSTWHDGGFATKSGTSMASPYVAGAAARYLAIHPGTAPATVKADLLSEGIPQADAAGFTGDTDGFPEPLLFVNGPAFGGDGTRKVAEPDPTAPPAPAFTALADGYTVDVAWSQVADPESGILSYRVSRDTVPPTTPVLVAETDHVTFTGLDRGDPGTTYTYKVTARNRQGTEGPTTEPITVTTSPDDPTDAGWWSFDGDSGPVAVDSTAWRRDGTLVGGAAKVGGALSLNGSDGRVDLDSTVLNGAGDVTATMWIKTTKSGTALISGANAGNSNEYLVYLASPTNLRFYTGSSSTAGVSWNLPYSVADGAWHHLAVVRDDTRNRADFYLAGTWVGAWGVGMDPIDIEPGGLVLGQDQDSVGGGFQTAEAFSGMLDEVGLYTRVLSAAEIAELAQADTTPPSAPPALSATTDVLRIDLSWSAADDPESGIAAYEIWRGTGGAKTLLATVPGTQTSYPDAHTTPATTYSYEVLAVNGVGLTGDASPEVSAITDAGSGDSALVGWWQLDETNGTVAADSSDYGLDGTLENGPGWTPDGQIGGALNFDGNNWVDFDSQILDGANDVTAAMWVNTTKTYIQALVSGANTGNDAEYELVLLSNPDLRLRFYTGESNTTYVWWPVPEVADGDWHHLAVTRNAAGDEAVLFVDGVSRGSRGAVFDQLAVERGGLLFGQEQDSVGAWNEANQAFVGSLDDLRLYRRLLSEAEISDLAGLDPPDTTPPVITLLGANPQTIEVGSSYTELGATAWDDRDLDISGDIVTDASAVDTSVVASYPVTYEVSDSALNPASQVIRIVDVVDTTPPVITLLGANPQTIEVGSSYTDLGATAIDNDPLFAGLVTAGGDTVDADAVGSYVVTYSASDPSGNTTVESRTVDVVDSIAPAAPSGLGASAGDGEVALDWSDNPEADLAWYTVYRSGSSGGPYIELASGLATSAYVDSAALNGTEYFYVVTATDTSGNDSADSEEVTAVPSSPPVPVVRDFYATSEATLEGSISSGNLVATLSSDNIFEALTEQHGGGRPSTRVSSLDHRWTFEIGNPDHATLMIEARRALNPDRDDFAFEYSTDGTSFLPLLVIDAAGDSVLQADLPEGTGGTVVIRVIDTDRTPGNASLDTVFIDELLVRTMSGASGMPRISVSATDPTAAEAGPDPGTFTLTRSNTDGVLSVGIGLTGSAGPDDHLPVDVSVDFPQGASTVTVVITPIDDANSEGPESIVLTVLPGSGYEVGVPDWAEVTIIDDDTHTEVSLAISETTVQGSATGGLEATFAADNEFEVIIEESQAGGKRTRLEHWWTFNVSGGATVVFSLEAFRSSDSDLFVFAYSTDGATWTDMITVSKTTDDNNPETFALPSGTSGPVYVRVQDTDRGRDDPVQSSISIDHLLIRSG